MKSSCFPAVASTANTHTDVLNSGHPTANRYFRFRAPNNDYSTTNLETVNDIIYINLFDEYVVDVVAVSAAEHYT